ncbi:MAG: hypothetical protein HY036_05840 [Nitrospirae bacterium]|nr:hypothetical protein [Nitrospirota bacterium]MBI3352082.1 hypothetical protein [Nitrospirota bacterium]
MTQKEKKDYFAQAGKLAEKIFRSKKRQRKLWAKQSMEKKIEELIQLQEVMVNINKNVKDRKLIPWKIK